jgi:hypothetical protein
VTDQKPHEPMLATTSRSTALVSPPREVPKSVPSVIAGMCHATQPVVPVPSMLAPQRGKSRGSDVTTIFLLIPGLVFALAAVGIVWIRLAAAEYRHNWSVPRDVSQGAYPRR